MDVSASRRLRAAIVGTGFIGPHHVDAVRRGGYADVVAIVDRDSNRGALTAQALGVERAVPDLDAVLDDPSIDVVHICTPNRTHVEFASAVMEAGKHVVVEKPIAIDRAGAATLLEVAQRTRRHAAVALTYRGYPMVQRARELVRSGRLGKLRLVHGGYLQDWLSDPSDYNWRVEAALGGPSRAFADIGTHWFDTAEYIADARTEAVMASLPTFVPVRHRSTRSAATFGAAGGETEPVTVDTEDAATVLIRFVGGAYGSMIVSQVSPGHKNALTVEVMGAERSLGWAQEDPERLWIRGREETTLLRREPSHTAPSVGVARLPAGHLEGWSEALRDLLVPFYAAIASGSPPPSPDADAAYPTLAAGARGIALVEAVVESARIGAWVPVIPIEPAASTTADTWATEGSSR